MNPLKSSRKSYDKWFANLVNQKSKYQPRGLSPAKDWEVVECVLMADFEPSIKDVGLCLPLMLKDLCDE